MKVIICGQRDFYDKNYLFRAMDKMRIKFDPFVTFVVHGDCRGADKLGEAWAKARGIEFKAYPADWKRYRNGAGPIRNQYMLDDSKAGMCFAFYNDEMESKGTRDMVSRALNAGLLCVIFNKATNSWRIIEPFKHGDDRMEEFSDEEFRGEKDKAKAVSKRGSSEKVERK